jgi:hypothetical protein
MFKLMTSPTTCLMISPMTSPMISVTVSVG